MKYDLIAEAYITLLIEGRIGDLKKQNPHLIDEIDSYSNQDPTPQKKFVPWLVSQHKKGNVTPDEPSLNQTLSGFETYKARHGINDHSSKSYQEIKDAVSPFLGTAATNKDLKKQQIDTGIDQIYNSPDNKIQAFHVNTLSASQHVYGGGKKLGGLHTNWCVSARSEDCLFGDYGRMFTVHVKNDPKSPYAIHPDNDTITTRDNAPDEYSIDKGLDKFPHLSMAVNAIHNHNEMLDKIKDDAYSNDHSIALSAINNPYADLDTIEIAASNKHPDVAIAAINHPKADSWVVNQAIKHPNANVAIAAINHHKADKISISNGLKHPDQRVREFAQNILKQK